MDVSIRLIYGGRCPYIDTPCYNNDPCETCEVEEKERMEAESLQVAYSYAKKFIDLTMKNKR